MRRAVIAAVLALGTLGLPGSTQAKAPPDDLTVVASYQVRSSTTDDFAPRRATGLASGPRSNWCRTIHHELRAYSPARVWLFSWHQRTRWCHTGYGVGTPVIMLDAQGRPPHTDSWATIPSWSPWDSDGKVVASQNGGAVGMWWVSRWRQGRFKVCVIHLPVCQTIMPWILQVPHGDGTFRVDKGS